MTPTAQSKSLLAKLLATENISIRQDSSAKTASFDVKNRILTLPVWQGISEDLNDMLIIHEVGHALDTPCDGWLDAMKRIAQDVHGKDEDRYVMAVKGFLNVVEDARIDRRQKLRYPGSRRNYLAGYKELTDRDFFGLKSRDPNVLSFIDRANLYFKGGSINMDIEFTSEERRLLNRMDNTETFEDVIKLTEELYRLAASRKDAEQQFETNDFILGESDEGEEIDFDKMFNDEDYEDGDDEDGRGSSGDRFGDENETVKKNNQTSRRGGKTDEDFVPKSETDEAFEKARENLADGTIKYVYVSIAKPDLKKIVQDYKTFLKDHEAFYSNTSALIGYEANWLDTIGKELSKIRNEENTTISYMVKEFEQRKAADIYSRQSIAKTGVIDTNKLHSYRYNDDIFRRLSIVPNGKNHGFVMFLDWSGSMLSNLKYTVRQLMSLTMFCKRVQIPFEVYLFRDNVRHDERFSQEDKKTEVFIGFSNDFVLRNVLSSRMNANELNRAYLYLWAAAIRTPSCERMHGTPLNEAIYVADEIVNNFRSKNKLQVVNTIFLTDGESNWSRFKDSSIMSNYTVDGKRVRKVYIYQDPKTKKEYTLNPNDTQQTTNTLLKVLKDRTNCNLVGFFLYESSNFQKVSIRFFSSAEMNEYTKKNSALWNEKMFVPVLNAGYDEYYIINPKSFRQSEVMEVLNIDPTMSKAKVAKEFLRYSEKKAINRVLLSRFMERVAGKIKNAA
jgi:hypothetical protein